MAKFCLKKPSKRIQARKRYKIEKKVRDHNRKLRREAKKNPKSKKAKLMNVPNVCPFKEDILKSVEAMKKQHDEERQKRRDEAKERKKEEKAKDNDESISDVEKMDIQDKSDAPDEDVSGTIKNEDGYLQAYYKECKKVLDLSDVILEVVDARDPLGTRCKQVEEAVRSAEGNKKLILVLNKADLVPKENLNLWLKYLRTSLPAVAFKASVPDQMKKISRKKMLSKGEDNATQESTCHGAELLLSLLGNYSSKNSGSESSIRVGIVGLPNVGKSSIINSLKRSQACIVGSTPGVTKAMQVVPLDSKIKLLDSPGIIFADRETEKVNESSVALKNAVKIQVLKDPFTPAYAILERFSKQQIMELYDMHDFGNSDEFFAKKAARMGLFKKGGVPNTLASARSVLNDWNTGKIRYYTVPPKDAVVTKCDDEFNIEGFAAEEKIMLDGLAKESEKKKYVIDPLLVESTGPVEAVVALESKRKVMI